MDNNKTITISLLITGTFIAGYWLSSIYTDDKHVVVVKKPTYVNDKVIAIKSEIIIKQNEHKQKTEPLSKKEKVVMPTIKLKPHHLYVRKSEYVKKDIEQREESRKRYLKMKQSRENRMREQRLRKHINQLKEKKDA